MRNVYAFVLTLLFGMFSSQAQVICIRCFDTNDSISSNVTNYIQNGSFEYGCGANGFFCPTSQYATCSLQNWACTNGGYATYANTYSGVSTIVPDGNLTAYFGNSFCNTCSSVLGDTSCLADSQCVTLFTPQPGFPSNAAMYGDTNGVSLSQIVTGLTPGAVYELEFWTGGEDGFFVPGMFAVDLGFGDIFLRCVATPSGGGTGKVYVIEFAATAASHVIKFTNWGHICNSCTELILDNVRLYPVAQLDPSVAPCALIGPPPTAVVGCSDTSFCGKQGINFYDLSTNNPTSWNWTFQGAVPSSSTLQNPVNIYYPNYGTFDVTLVACNGNGCDTIYMPDYIVEFQTPTVTLTQSNDTLFATGNGQSFQWYSVAGGIINGAYDPFYVAFIPGEYYCVVTDSIGCQGASPNILVTNVNELDAFKEQIKLLPNPFASQLTIESNNTEEKEIVIFDITSRELIRENFIETHTLNTEALSKGVYFYEIKGKQGGFKTGRIIKQ